MVKIVIPGGSGQVGTVLARALHATNNDVVILSRQPARPGPWRWVQWDAASVGSWCDEIDGADVVINLAGRSVNCRYTDANRALIMRSRVEATRAVGEAIAAAAAPPSTWLQASTATIYAHSYDHANDEITGVIGGSEPDAPSSWHFSIDVARAWEAACTDVELPNTRKVLMRSAMIMSPDRGGIFDTLLTLVRRGLGGTSGDGRQFLSWIHDADFIAAVRWLIDSPDVEGAVNLAAPTPVSNAEFMRVLRRAWGAPFGLPATKLMLAIGAVFMRTETELVLKSRRVVPGRLTDAGFEFAFPEWADAARDLCERVRTERMVRAAAAT